MISKRNEIENMDFFGKMIELGFLDTVENDLPEDFTLIYEIARILENELNPLTKQLAPILWLTQSQEDNASLEKEIIPHLPSGDDYEANLISSFRDIAKIYPHQFLLPDEVFMQKLVERSLWMPAPKASRNYRYQAESDQFAPDSRKQKIYLLFDTSKSMQEMFRIHLSKAIAYFFLKQNQKEMGTIFFRTFDAEIGPLQLVRDKISFDNLIAHIMGLKAEGRGTAMEKALLTAIQDIRADSFMAEAEILVITDGAAHIDVDKVKHSLGESIHIHCIKIGSASLKPDTKTVLNLIHSAESDDAKLIRELQHKLKDLEYSHKATQADARKSFILGEIQYLNKQIQAQIDRYSQRAIANYGNEISELSDIFINVEDIKSEKLFALSKDRIDEFVQLSSELLTILKDDPSVEDAKKAAVLYDHLHLLLKYNNIETQQLSQNTDELKLILSSFLQQQQSQSAHNSSLDLSDNDHIQLSRLLKTGMQSAARIPLAKLLLILYRKIKKSIILWRKARLRTKKRKYINRT